MSFYPCSGGNGASVLAAACSINLAAKGKKVLYLNLEQFGVPGVFFNAEGAFNLSDLIYAIKSKKANVVLKLESSVKEDKSGVYFFDECKIPLDFMELTSEDVKKLIDVIKSSSLFDYIIIDTDMLLNDVSKEIMMYSDRIIFASSGTENSNLKFSRIYKTLEIVERQMNASLLQKISVIYNKFNNTSGKYIDGIPNLNILGCVGEFNRSASALIARQISQMQIFDNI
ncbi:MAG: CobQ/CobB/MinD/ParA nucleotide binding domain protein [Firmicutes bacterium ADurb.Bin419]|nr:MAG: CobQ/CobB/MinD/ParA nucleotide binding domain protein [Firmicutes bacterium ADurb.Bin419]